MRRSTLSILLSIVITSSAMASASAQARTVGATHHPYQLQTENELEAWLALEPHDSPLRLLKADERIKFLDSLYFSEKGLASFSYGALDGLRPSELSRLLTLFGLPSSLDSVLNARQERASGSIPAAWPPPNHEDGIDYPGYVCRSRGNCGKSAMDNICIGANC